MKLTKGTLKELCILLITDNIVTVPLDNENDVQAAQDLIEFWTNGLNDQDYERAIYWVDGCARAGSIRAMWIRKQFIPTV